MSNNQKEGKEMDKILTALQMKTYDNYTINKIGIPSMVLMEKAALSVLDEIKKYIVDTNLKPETSKILILCGTGNNGGDGLALARLLYDCGFSPDIVLLGDKEKLSTECEKQFSILRQIGLSIRAEIEKIEYDIIVDALLGIGLHRKVEGLYYKTIQEVNKSNAYKIAIDIPTGLDTDSGEILGIGFMAHLTVTFGYYKRGLFLGEGPKYCGKIVLKDIGITKIDLEPKEQRVYAYTKGIKGILPYRNPCGNKGSFGKIFIYAGGEKTFGAALLCVKSAFSAGAGMVKVFCPKEYRQLFLEQIPEAMLTCYEPGESKDCIKKKIIADLDWADALIAGPGIGKDEFSCFVLQILMKYAKVPMVLDADALNILSTKPEWIEDLLHFNEQYHRTVIMTPHLGEMARLLHVSVDEIKESPFEKARELSQKYDCIAVCKDARTIICYKDEAMYLNLSGNHGMATAGSGDVLSGILGAYIGFCEDYFKYTQVGVYLHGLAGDEAAKEIGERAVMASHIIDGMIKLQKGN